MVVRELCRISVGAIYFPKFDPPGTKYVGNIRLRVLDTYLQSRKGKASPNRDFPLIFIPSETNLKKINFYPEGAFTGTKGDYNDHRQKVRWEVFPFKVPPNEKEKLTAIYSKLEDILDTIVDNLVPFRDTTEPSQNNVLSHYPQQITDILDPSQAYRTINGDKLIFNVREDNLPSYDGGRVRGVINSRKRFSIPSGIGDLP